MYKWVEAAGDKQQLFAIKRQMAQWSRRLSQCTQLFRVQLLAASSRRTTISVSFSDGMDKRSFHNPLVYDTLLQ